jgi:hypothetical protein
VRNFFARKPGDDNQDASDASAPAEIAETPARQRHTTTADRASQAVVRAAELVPDDRLADDLVRRVLIAILQWSETHGLHGLPPDIMLDQALAILNARQRLQREYEKMQQSRGM